jgi:tRNA (guanosine-2'-O-)-methyltransferase
MKEAYIDYLSELVTSRRIERIENILKFRTRYITIVLEDIYQSQNASAVLRSAESFGIQDIHVVENKHKFAVNPDVAMGSSNWLTLFHYNQEGVDNSLESIQNLRQKGYRIVATTPNENATLLEDFDLDKGKIALLFGTELTGLSDVAMAHADEFLKIPSFGFTESLNISVSAGIVSFCLSQKLRRSNINWELTLEEKKDLKITWLKQKLKTPQLLEKRFLEGFKR